ncbi:MAG: cupin domain-containing protein [Chloroflexi bacterium]|nr:cupin domain-containing protein [Chloroflexota bacterium]
MPEGSERFHWPLGPALSGISPESTLRSNTVFTHGTLRLLVYAPRGDDPQQPHDQDEVYVIQTGTGWFVNGADRHRFGPGDSLFVPAGVEHRFEEFSDDLSMWVVFWGPDGGESA